MTRTIVLGTAFFAGLLGGCGGQNDSNWSSDCLKHYSVNSREFSECKAKVEAHRQVEVQPNTVSVDPGNTSRPGFEETGKGARGYDNY